MHASRPYPRRPPPCALRHPKTAIWFRVESERLCLGFTPRPHIAKCSGRATARESVNDRTSDPKREHLRLLALARNKTIRVGSRAKLVSGWILQWRRETRRHGMWELRRGSTFLSSSIEAHARYSVSLPEPLPTCPLSGIYGMPSSYRLKVACCMALGTFMLNTAWTSIAA